MELIDFKTQINEPTVISTGNFDGVHAGHHKLLTELKNRASELHFKSAILTFVNHPRAVFDPDITHQALTTFDEKIEKLSYYADFIIHTEFDENFASLSPSEFMVYLQSNYSMRYYIAGHDHHIGKLQSGSFDNLQKIAQQLQFSLDRVGPYLIDGEPVSSTRIKRALSEGNAESAEMMLGYKYHIEGIVVEGKKLGRTIGYPTANINCPGEKALPARGVYAVCVKLHNKIFRGMLNIGYNPTVSSLKELSIEVHILDFDDDIYGELLRVEFCKKIRDEKAFSGKDELVENLDSDKSIIRDYFLKNSCT
jgi:riboflavin kinase/FMN adenylyltransferase